MTKIDDLFSAFHLEPAVWCGCNGKIAIPQDVVRRYLASELATCPRCNSSQDWWSVLLDTAKSVMTAPLSVIGAHRSVLQLVLRQGQEAAVDFTAAGVPADARILRVFYTAAAEGDRSPLFPLQVLTSQPPPPWIPRQLTIYPHALDSQTAADMSTVNVLVAWLPADEADASRTQLIEAFDAYTRGGYQPAEYDQCIIPANTAVEVALGGLMARWLREHASAENVRRFLNDAATYGHQLNVLLPVMVGTMGAPQLPEHIRGSLNRLRSLRNQIAHGGAPKTPISKQEAAECLCAAFFGVEYVRVIEQLKEPSLRNPTAS